MSTNAALQLRETWHLDSGPGTPVRVLRYRVEGMPYGEEAEIAELPVRGEWSILRTKQGVVGAWSEKAYDSPDAALSALHAELTAVS